MSRQIDGLSASCEVFRDRLRQLRDDAGLTIEGAAEAAGVEPWAWKYVETKRTTAPSVPTCRRMLRAVGVQPIEADRILAECRLL